MFRFFQDFRRDECGAVTVDWVVICAGVVALCVAIVTAMQTGAVDLSDDVKTFMTGWFS